MPLNLTAAADDNGRRLDRILRKALRDLPLSAIHRLLRTGSVLVDGKTAPADFRVQCGQTITVKVSDDFTPEKAQKAQMASGLILPEIILYEGEGLLILNKPEGITVHGRESLADWVLNYLKPKIPPSLSFRPGPLHRLDKPSSGIIVFSTSLEGARFFSAILRERKVVKRYLAIVEGVIKKGEVWTDELVRDHKRKKTFRAKTGNKIPGSADTTEQAKTALTRVSPLAYNQNCTLILAVIETGRTHQIRAQAAEHGHPLLGDKKYGSLGTKGQAFPASESSYDNNFLLHAWRMEFPENTPLPRSIEAPLSERFREKIRELFKLSDKDLLFKYN